MDASEDPAALALTLRVLIGKLRRRLLDQADTGDLSPSQTAALQRLERDGPATVSALARAEGVRSQSMGATIAGLQAADLVAGAPDPSDGRQTLLSLTPACREWLGAGRAARQDWLTRALARELSADELSQLAGAVALLTRVVNA